MCAVCVEQYFIVSNIPNICMYTYHSKLFLFWEKDIYFMIIIFCVFISFFHFITFIQWQRLSIRFDADFFLYYTLFKMHIFMMYEAYLIVEGMIL